MKYIKIACYKLLLLHIVSAAEAQNQCPQRNELLPENAGSTVLVVRTAPGTDNIIASHTGYLMPMRWPNSSPQPQLTCSEGMSLYVMTDARIVDINDNHHIDENWWKNTYVIFNYNLLGQSCHQDLNPYELGDNYFKFPTHGYYREYSSPVAAPIILFSPYNEYGFCLLNVIVNRRREIPYRLLPLKTFSVSFFPYNNEPVDVPYHPMNRRVVKNAKIPTLPAHSPENPPPGSEHSLARHWIKTDLMPDESSECSQSNMDDYDSRGAAMLLWPRNETGAFRSKEPSIFAHYSRSSAENATCTDKDLWFVKLRDIWGTRFYSTYINAPREGYSFFQHYHDGIREWTNRILWSSTYVNGININDDEDFDFEGSEGVIHSVDKIVFRRSGEYNFSSGKEVAFQAPTIKVPDNQLEPFEIEVSNGSQVSFFTQELVSEEGAYSFGLTVKDEDSKIELHPCQLTGIKGLLPIRAIYPEGDADKAPKINFSYWGGNTVHIGRDDNGVSFELDKHTETVLFVHGDLNIDGLPVLPKGQDDRQEVLDRLQLYVTGEIEWNTDPVRDRTNTIEGTIRLVADDLYLNGKTLLSETSGKMQAWISDKITIEGEWICRKGAQVQAWTNKLIARAGKFVAEDFGEINIFYEGNRNASLKRMDNLSTNLKASGGGKIRIRPVSIIPPAPEGPNFPNPCSVCPSAKDNNTTTRDNISSKERLYEPVVGEIKQSETTFYPNPFTDQLTIRLELQQPVEHLQLQIYNQQGVQVHSQQINNVVKGNTTITWKATSVSSGIYFIRIVDEKGKIIIQQKAIKQ